MLTPLGLDVESSWQNALKGASGIDTIKSFDVSTSITKIGGELKGFDPTTRLDKKDASHMDRVSQIACHAAYEAMENANLTIDQIDDPYRAAVVVGSGIGGLETFQQAFKIFFADPNLAKQVRKLSPYTVPMLTIDSVAANISILLGFHGAALGIVSACATGGDSIAQAAMMLQSGQADVALAGGSEATVLPLALGAFNACRALSTRNDSPQTASRPFDKGRDGFVMGEGACVLVMETAEHAKKRNAKPLFELAGYANTSDAYHATRPLPTGAGAIVAMQRVLAMANIAPEQVDYINAHGTSTYWNDISETIAIKEVFKDHAYKVPTSSTKSMTGHLIGAAGAVEIAFCALSMRDGIIPPTINLNEPDEKCDLDYVPNQAREHKTEIAMSNSFGFGGHNVSLVIKKVAD